MLLGPEYSFCHSFSGDLIAQAFGFYSTPVRGGDCGCVSLFLGGVRDVGAGVLRLALSGLWVGGLWTVSKLGVCAPHLPKFIQLVSLNDTLLVVSILNIVYDCCL